MIKNKAVVYKEPGVVAVETIDYPKLEINGKKCEHAVILKVITTNICGSDQHMVRGRTTAPSGLVLGHEITGEVIECGSDVLYIKKNDIVSVPFNVACGRCRNCKAQDTHICLNVNPARPGAAYGYVDMGGWIGGQAEYVMIPYADFNLLVLPKQMALEKIKDFSLLSDIFPTGYHGALRAGVQPGSTVYIAGAGPVGLACAASCHLRGAACVIIGDNNQERLDHAKKYGTETINLTTTSNITDGIEKILGTPSVDCAIDCVGYEAHGSGAQHAEQEPANVLNTLMDVTRAGGALGIPGLYVTGDPGAQDPQARQGTLGIRIGLGWSKGLSFFTGQTPVMRYHRELMECIIHNKIHIADAVNATIVSLDDAPQAYQEFNKGVAKKFILDPWNTLKK
ncbi:MAG: formaldehyde dehydrogenase, glutathione-independent [Candidatus Babeliaceae bacterium]|jgi:glutathione-independent formaldehyde dehydrogenase